MKQLNNETIYAFVLGREQKIALFELQSVLRHFGICFKSSNPILTNNVAFIKVDEKTNNEKLITKNCGGRSIKIAELISVLGGTVKIFKIVALKKENIATQISNIILKYRTENTGKLKFGISDYRQKKIDLAEINRIGLTVKKNIKERKINSRFLIPKEGNELPSIVSHTNKLSSRGIEIGLFNLNHQEQIGALLAVNNPIEWSKRDYEKPAGDKFSGMCPPKLGRIMVNVALGESTNIEARISKQYQNSNDKNSKLVSDFDIRNSDLRPSVVDPFCGSGNILMEAKVLGCQIIGCDISERAVADTRANLNWLMSRGNHTDNHTDRAQIKTMKQSNNVFVADATKFDFSSVVGCRSLDGMRRTTNDKRPAVIVTEPYLGQPKKYKPSLNATRGEYQKIKTLYLEFLRNIKRCDWVRNIAIIFPLVETADGGKFSLFSECVDEIEKIGYTFLCEPFIYGREYQVVKRQIVLLKARISKHEIRNNIK